MDFVFFGAAKQGWKIVSDLFIKKPIEKQIGAKLGEEHTEGDKHTFAEALTQIQKENSAYAVILDDFMSNDSRDPDHLKNLDERNDFLINAARTGKGVEGTKVFLVELAKLDSHRARRRRLNNLSFIGEGQQDFFQRHEDSIERAKQHLRSDIDRMRRRNKAFDRLRRRRRWSLIRKPRFLN